MKLQNVRSLRALVLAGCLVLLWSGAAVAGEKTYTMDRTVNSGGSFTIDVPDRVIRRVDVLLRRLNKQDTDCNIAAGYKGQPVFNNGKGAQVDREDLHEVVIMTDNKRSQDRDLLIQVHGGGVNIREVTVHFD